MSSELLAVPSDVFGWSAPAPMADGTVPAPWRVADRDQMRRVLDRLGWPGAYVDGAPEHSRATLFVGIRDNRDPVEHVRQLEHLGSTLRSRRFVIEPVISEGRLRAWYVVDSPLRLVVESASSGARWEEHYETEAERAEAAMAHQRRGARTLGIGAVKPTPEQERAAAALFARCEFE